MERKCRISIQTNKQYAHLFSLHPYKVLIMSEKIDNIFSMPSNLAPNFMQVRFTSPRFIASATHI